jgi:hypothetical protein
MGKNLRGDGIFHSLSCGNCIVFYRPENERLDKEKSSSDIEEDLEIIGNKN